MIYLCKVLAIINVMYISEVLTIAIVLTTNPIYADGIDDPNFYKEEKPPTIVEPKIKDRNFYNDFSYCFENRLNNTSPTCRKYDFMGPFTWRDNEIPSNDWKIIPIPSREVESLKPKASVPEPSNLLLLTLGTIVFCIWRKFK